MFNADIVFYGITFQPKLFAKALEKGGCKLVNEENWHHYFW